MCVLAVLLMGACSSDGDSDATAASVGTDVSTSVPAAASTLETIPPPTLDSATSAPTTAVAQTSPTVAVAETSPTAAVAPSTTTPAVSRPAGPAADLSEALTGGSGVFIGSASVGELEGGYVEEEFVAAGTASEYHAVGALTADGRWSFELASTADYRTRVLVRRPTDTAAFSGNVIVEWLNVSGGIDADPDFATLREEIVRNGDIWVGVSAQRIGVEGGRVAVPVSGAGAESVAGKGLIAIDPARYGSLRHPGDAFAYDIFTQVARAVRVGGASLGGMTPSSVVAAGESQSAFALVTYLNGVQPLTHAFDGFFVHSRGATGLALVAPGEAADIAGSFAGITTIIRDDTTVPVFELQSESDVAGILNSLAARQPDTDLFRLWEVAGTAHADAHLIGASASAIDCGVPINDGPMHIVAKAALRHFLRWVTTGDLPPAAPLLEVNPADGQLLRGADGIARGGVRTPPVDVPTRTLSSIPGRADAVICLLLGSTNAIPAERLAALYTSPVDFEQRYAAAVDAAIAAGFVLADDRAALEGFAHPELLQN